MWSARSRTELTLAQLSDPSVVDKIIDVVHSAKKK